MTRSDREVRMEVFNSFKELFASAPIRLMSRTVSAMRARGYDDLPSWLNQVEIWFSILAGKSLRGASFTSITQLRQHIDAFIEAYNADATPFVWTKAVVHQRRYKGRRISQL